MALTPGSRLGPYEVTALIGEGGMGKVWRAHHTALRRDDALKVLPDAFASDPDRVARFQREAQVLASLNHPNIAHVYGLERTDGVQALVMELVEGPTLADRIAQGPIPVEEALPIAKQIAEALEAAHERGIIHRDLKPANIKVRPDGTVKVLDFGLAKALEPITAHGVDATVSPTITSPAMITGVGVLLGTAAYMSPEQARGKTVDKRADIWAFGAVLYEMLTGKRAFDGENVSETLARVIEREPDFSMLPRRTPSAIVRLLARAVVKDRQMRLPDIAVARIELSEVMAGASGDVMFARPELRPRSAWRERVTWMTVVAALLGISFYLAFVRERVPATAEVTRFAVYPPRGTVLNGPVYATVGQPQFALSPDGRSLVFVATTPGAKPVLWLRTFDEPEPRILTGTDYAESPFWAPDSASVAFFAEGQIKTLRLTTGLVQTMADIRDLDPRGGSWGSDGTILLGTGNGPVFRVTEKGGTPQPITTLDASAKEASHRWPTLLPDNRLFIFNRRGELPDRSGIYLASIDGEANTLLVRNMSSALYVPPGVLLFTNGGTLLGQAFDTRRLELVGQSFVVAERVGVDSRGTVSMSASRTGTLAYAAPSPSQIGQLTWFGRDGKLLAIVGSEGDYTDFRLSPDDTRLAVSLVDPRAGAPDIWLTDLQRGSPSLFARSPVIDAGALWSPDGTRLVFRTTRRGGNVEFYEKSAAGGGDDTPVLLSDTQRAAGPLALNLYLSDWSPDGQQLLYTAVTSFSSELWVLPLNDRKPARLLRWPSLGMHATFSPDGRLVTYTSDESGTFEVYAQTFPLSDRKFPISVGGGYEPRWRADGREIYYLSNDRTLMAVSVGSGPSFGLPRPLFQTRVAAGVTPYRNHYVPSRDGQRFLVNTATGNSDPVPISVVVNWQSGVDR